MIKESDIISFTESRGRYSIEYYSGHFIVIVAVTVASMNSRSLLYPIPKPYTARLLRL